MHGMVALLGFMSLPGYKATIRAILSQILTSSKARDVKFCVRSHSQVRDTQSIRFSPTRCESSGKHSVAIDSVFLLHPKSDL